MNLGKTAMPISLFVGQCVAMFSIVPMVMYADWIQWVICLLMYQCIVTIGISAGYHRYISHKTFETNTAIQFVMLFFAHIMMVGSAILWVANHREHHRFSDTDKDPHSPTHKGYFYSHFLQVFTEPKTRYMIDLIKNPVYRFQHKYYWELLLIWALILYIIDPFAIVYAWLAPAGISKLLGSLVYSYAHRNNKANNDVWVALVSGGEGFHQVHHSDPRLIRWDTLDTGGWFVELVKK